MNGDRYSVAKFRQGLNVYERRLVKCGKKACWCARETLSGVVGHGPYWYLCGLRSGVWLRIYLGRDLDTTRYIDKRGRIDWAAVMEKRRGKAYGNKTIAVGPAAAPKDMAASFGIEDGSVDVAGREGEDDRKQCAQEENAVERTRMAAPVDRSDPNRDVLIV